MEHLRDALHTLVIEQQELAQKAAYSTPSLGRLNQRLIIMERYFLALTRKGTVVEVVESVCQESEEAENGAEEREEGGVIKPELPESESKAEEVEEEEGKGEEEELKIVSVESKHRIWWVESYCC